MFGLNNYGVNQYAQVGLETGVLAADPNKLIIMLYDGAIAACYSAIPHIQNKNFKARSASLSHATIIIESGLRACLDKSAGGEIAQSLDGLYVYMVSRLSAASVRNQVEPVNEVIKLLMDLRSAWEAIGKKQAPEAVAPMGGGRAGGMVNAAYLAKV